MSRHCGQPWCSKTSITPLLNMPALGITWHASAQTCARASSWNAKRKDQVAVCSAGISCQIPHKQKSTTTHSSCVPAGSLMPSHLVVLQLSLTHNAGSRRCWGKGWCRRAQPIFDISNRRRKKKKMPAFGMLPRRPSKVRVATQRSTFFCNAATASANRMCLTRDCESIAQVCYNVHVCLSIYLSFYLSLSVYLSIYLSIYPSIHPSIYLSIYMLLS